MIARISEFLEKGLWTRIDAVVALMTMIAVVLTLAAGIASLTPPRVEGNLKIAEISADGGFAYTTPISIRVPIGYAIMGDGPGSVVSNLQLLENGQLLGPAHSLHSEIRESGKGRYSHWQARLWFSASDSTDPRVNGRIYSASAKASIHPFIIYGIVLLDLACIWACRRHFRRRYPSIQGPARERLNGSDAISFWARLAMALIMIAGGLVLAGLAHLEYRTNDDVSMRFIAESIIGSPEQSQFLIFQNVLVGLLLHALYAIRPALPWYDVVLATCTVSGALLCAVSLLRFCATWRENAFCVVLGLTFFTPMFQAYQFTASAMLLGAGALLTLASIVHLPPKTRFGVWAASAAILLAFLAGGLVRFQGALLGAVLVFPALKVVDLIRLRRRLWMPTIALFAGVVGSFLLQAYDHGYYSKTPGWESYREQGRQLAGATEYAFVDRTQEKAWEAALSAAKWSDNDYRMVSGWLFQNRELFSSERIKRFADLVPSTPITKRLDSFREMLTAPRNLAWIVPIFCFGAALLRRSRQGFVRAFLSMLSAVTVFAAMAVAFKTGFEHIYWPVYTVVVLAGVAAVLGDTTRSRQRGGYLAIEDKLVGAAVLLGVAGLALLQVDAVFARGVSSDELRRRVDHDVAAWPVGPSSLIVVWDRNFPFETWVRPFQAAAPSSRRFFHTNAPSLTPIANSVYAEWGTSDIAWSMCHLPGIYRVDARLGYADSHTQILKTYMREHFHEDVDVVPVFEGQALSLYGCRVTASSASRQ